MSVVTALEADFGFSVRDDYREFLATVGGHGDYLETASLIVWPGVTAKIGGSSEADIEEESPEYWTRDIARLYGLGGLRSALETARAAGGHMAGWHLGLLGAAYPIGTGYGGDVFIQAVDGEEAGSIFHLHHDEWMEDEVDDLLGLGTDELLEAVLANWVADDFKTLYQNPCAIRGAREG